MHYVIAPNVFSDVFLAMAAKSLISAKKIETSCENTENAIIFKNDEKIG